MDWETFDIKVKQVRKVTTEVARQQWEAFECVLDKKDKDEGGRLRIHAWMLTAQSTTVASGERRLLSAHEEEELGQESLQE